MPDTKNEWLESDIADPLPSLDKINEGRQMEMESKPDLPPPPPPMPAEEPQKPIEPIQDKDLAKLLEDSAKALLDASLSIEKSSVSLKKILVKLGPGDASEDDKINDIIGDISEMGAKAKALSEVISSYRESVVSKEAV